MPPKRKSSSASKSISVANAVEAQRLKIANANMAAANKILSSSRNSYSNSSQVDTESDTETDIQSGLKQAPISAPSLTLTPAPAPVPMRAQTLAPPITPDSRDFDDELTEQLLAKYAPEEMYVPPAAKGRRSLTPKAPNASPVTDRHGSNSTTARVTDGPFSVPGMHINANRDTNGSESPSHSMISQLPDPTTCNYAGLDAADEPAVILPAECTNSLTSVELLPGQKQQLWFQSPTSSSTLFMYGAVAGAVVLAIATRTLTEQTSALNSEDEGTAMSLLLPTMATAEVVRTNLGTVSAVLVGGAIVALLVHTLLGWIQTKQRRDKLLILLLQLLRERIRSRPVGGVGGYPSRFYMEELADHLAANGGTESGTGSDFLPPVSRREVVALWPEVEERICAEDTRIRRVELTVSGERDWMFQWLRGDDYVSFGQAQSEAGDMAGGGQGDNSPAEAAMIYAKTGLSYS